MSILGSAFKEIVPNPAMRAAIVLAAAALLVALWRMDSVQREMRADIDGIRTDIDGIRTEQRGMRADIDGIRTEQRGMRADIEDLRTDIEQIEGQLSSVQSTLDQIKGGPVRTRPSARQHSGRLTRLVRRPRLDLGWARTGIAQFAHRVLRQNSWSTCWVWSRPQVLPRNRAFQKHARRQQYQPLRSLSERSCVLHWVFVTA